MENLVSSCYELEDVLSLNVCHLVNTCWHLQSLRNHYGEKDPKSKRSVIFLLLCPSMRLWASHKTSESQLTQNYTRISKWSDC